MENLCLFAALVCKLTRGVSVSSVAPQPLNDLVGITCAERAAAFLAFLGFPADIRRLS